MPVVVNRFQLEIALRCLPAAGMSDRLAGYMANPASLHVATVVTLERSSGNAIRLLNDFHDAAPLTRTGEDAYVLTLRFEPENPTEVVGRDVSDLEQIESLGVRFGGVLKAIGLRDEEATIARFVVRLNGRDMTHAALGAMHAGVSPDFEKISVAKYFRGMRAAYVAGTR